MSGSKDTADPYTDITQKLETECIAFFLAMGMPLDEARKGCRKLLDTAMGAARAEGTLDLPVNYGDILLQQELTSVETRSRLDKLRREGVTDTDIRVWWNMHDLQRRMMLALDDHSKFAAYLKWTKGEGCTHEQAVERLHNSGPHFGDPEDASRWSGNDRPLPFELKDRINGYVTRRSAEDLSALEHDIKTSSSFNAFVRSEIARGKL